MQHYSTYELRRYAYDILIEHGPMTLSDLAQQIGCPKEMLQYAIESATPFGAMFKKEYVDEKTGYEAVPIEDAYGGEDFY